MIEPRKREQPGDGGGSFANPGVYDTLEDALAAGTVEDRYLDSLDQSEEDDTNEQD